jgi:CRP-like cAMP-binding protein
MSRSDVFTKSMSVGNVLFLRGEASDHAVIVQKGRVTLLLDGQIEIGIFGPGSILGWSEVFACRNYQTSAIPIDQSVAEYIPQRRLFAGMLHDAAFGFQIVQCASYNLGELIRRIRSLPRCRKQGGEVRASGRRARLPFMQRCMSRIVRRNHSEAMK